MKLVSIIIPTRNSAAFLERCLESIKTQTYPEIEIIIVDNHSSDATPEISARYGNLITGGPERSAQFNQGAKLAHGDYLYRVDGDFELDPKVVEACVAAIEDEGNDIVAVPNRSAGGSYWARVRRLERDTYLDDDLIVAARFWRREAFEAVGGFDESLVACEDYDLHSRMINHGYKLGRVKPGEIHLGEPNSLWANVQKSFYYGHSAWNYLRKNPSPGLKQLSPFRASFWRHRRELLKHPAELLGLFFLKIAQYSAAGMAISLAWLGFLDETNRFSSPSFGGLIIMLASITALLNQLPRYGIRGGKGLVTALVLAGFFSWILAGSRWAKWQHKSKSGALLTASLVFTPYLLFFAFGNFLTQVAWLFIFSIVNALVVAGLVYLYNPGTGSQRWAPWALAVILVAFATFFIVRLAGQLSLRNITAHEIIYYDQALWSTANGVMPGRQLLYSTILERSMFSEVAAPVFLFYLPLYKLGLGTPFLLLASQIVFIGLIVVALYRLGETRFGKAPALIIASAYLVYYLTPRLVGNNFYPETLGMAALILGLDALERKHPGPYFLWILLAVTCGDKIAIALTVMGVVLLFWNKDRWIGVLTLFIGLVSTWILMFVFLPYFGGMPFQLPYSAENFDLGTLIGMLSQSEVLNYLVLLLAPLGFAPLLGAPWLLPAVPLIFLSILFRRINAPGPSEVVISAFLFVAILFGFAWVVRKWPTIRRESLQIAGAVFIIVTCLLSARFLSANLDEWRRIDQPGGPIRGYSVLTQIPDEASLATQSSLALSLAHRPQLYLLPKVEEADIVLVDLFANPEQSQKEILQTVVQRIFNNPEYSIQAESGGVLLFKRGQNDSKDLDLLARARPGEIQFPTRVVLANTIAYRGYSLDSARLLPGQPAVITTYWESLAPVERPYQFFFACPGEQQFQEAVFGLYPTAVWQPGELIRQRFSMSLPSLPEGDEYEVVAGLWFDTGGPALSNPSQLLGEDVVRIANIKVSDDYYQLQPWQSEVVP